MIFEILANSEKKNSYTHKEFKVLKICMPLCLNKHEVSSKYTIERASVHL